MTALEKIRELIEAYPGYDILNDFQVDYTDQIPANGGVFPSGLVVVDRREDILGNVEITNQYNFGIYCVFAKAAKDDVGASINADWLMEFQEWVQEQSVRKLVPVFGDEPDREQISAQNGALYETDDGTATYMVQLSVTFIKRYEVT